MTRMKNRVLGRRARPAKNSPRIPLQKERVRGTLRLHRFRSGMRALMEIRKWYDHLPESLLIHRLRLHRTIRRPAFLEEDGGFATVGWRFAFDQVI